MLLAEFAIFVHFDSVRVVFLVFHRVVVALLAFLTRQSDFYAHVFISSSLKKGFSPFAIQY
jgi:hypothetical protein